MSDETKQPVRKGFKYLIKAYQTIIVMAKDEEEAWALIEANDHMVESRKYEFDEGSIDGIADEREIKDALKGGMMAPDIWNHDGELSAELNDEDEDSDEE